MSPSPQKRLPISFGERHEEAEHILTCPNPPLTEAGDKKGQDPQRYKVARMKVSCCRVGRRRSVEREKPQHAPMALQRGLSETIPSTRKMSRKSPRGRHAAPTASLNTFPNECASEQAWFGRAPQKKSGSDLAEPIYDDAPQNKHGSDMRLRTSLVPKSQRLCQVGNPKPLSGKPDPADRYR